MSGAAQLVVQPQVQVCRLGVEALEVAWNRPAVLRPCCREAVDHVEVVERRQAERLSWTCAGDSLAEAGEMSPGAAVSVPRVWVGVCEVHDAPGPR